MKNFKFAILSLATALFCFTGLQAQTITGKGSKVKKELSLSSFKSIGLGANATVYISKGSQKVVVEGQENIINELKKEVNDGSWNIGFGKNKKVKNYDKLTIHITMPTVKNLSIGGSGEIIGEDTFNNLGEVKFSIAGSGMIEFKGSASSAKVNIAGSGDARLADMELGDCKVSIAGSGDAMVDVSGDLNISIAGSGDVRYKGSPKVKSSIAGSGNVRSM